MRLPDQLLPLSGPLRGAYRVLAPVLIVLFALVGTVGDYLGQEYTRQMATAFYGAGVRNVESRPGAIGVAPFSSEAHAAGLPTGRLVAVNGVDVSGLEGLSAKLGRLLSGPEGSSIVLRVADGANGSVRDYRLTRSAHYLRDAYAGTGITFAARKLVTMLLDIAYATIATLVLALLYLRRPRDPVAALIVVGVSIAGLSALPVVLASLQLDAALPASASYVAIVVGSLVFFGGMVIFPSGSLRPRWALAAYALIVLLAAAVLLPAAVRQDQGPVEATMPLIAVIALAVLTARFRASAPGIERQQIKWAMLGLAGLGFFFALEAVIDAYSQSVASEGLRAWLFLLSALTLDLALISVVSGFLVALLRYRLYDAESAISRSAVFATLAVSLLAIFAGSEKVVEALGEQYFRGSLGAMAGGVAAALAAITIGPLHGRLSRWAEHRFQNNLISLRRDLPALVGDLRETLTAAEIAERVLQRVATLLRANGGALTFDGGAVVSRDIAPAAFEAWREVWTPAAGQSLDCDRADPLLPIRVPLAADGCGRVGWLFLGPRPDGSLYGRDEREALSAIADPVARALAIALRRETAAVAVSGALERLAGRMASLEAVVARLSVTPAN